MNILIINRRFFGWNWNAIHTAYHNVIDHKAHHIHYIVDGKSMAGLHENEKSNARVITIGSLNNAEQVKAAAHACHQQCGGLDRIIALNEEDLTVASELREELDIPGERPDNTIRFRNKLVMKEVIRNNNLPAPEFTHIRNATALLEKYGFPIVLKPLAGFSSKGVYIPRNPEELKYAIDEITKAGEFDRYECEQYIDGEIFHLDGFMLQNALQFCQVYQYYNSCFDFANGKPVGVTMVDNPQKISTLTDFAVRVFNALQLTDGPFHLELFIGKDGVARFLEMGARVGGAFVAQCIEKRWGINLYEQTLAWQINSEFKSSAFAQLSDGGQKYGWLLFPVPSAKGAQVKHVQYSLNLPEVVMTILPEVGQIMDQSGGYIHTGGTFLIAAPSQLQQLEVIEKILANYRVEFDVAHASPLLAASA